MEKLIKNALGQWKLIGEMLRKSPEETPKPAPTVSPDMKANSEKLSKLFSEQNAHVANGRAREAFETKGKIKDMVLRAPRGSIDMGHLGSMRDTQLPIKHPDGTEWTRPEEPLHKRDMVELINHHLGDAKSLKDMHDNHGGLKTVEAVLKTMGAAADPTYYSSMKFKNPNTYLDMVDLMNPNGKSEYERNDEGSRAKGIFPKGIYSKTQSDPELHKKVHQTWESLHEGENTHVDRGRRAAHEKATIDRAMDMFKRHHKL